MEPDITDVAFHVEVEMEIPQDRSAIWQYPDNTDDRTREPGQQDNDTIAKVLQRAPGLGESLRELQENVLAKGS
jgi:hypothetical protein